MKVLLSTIYPYLYLFFCFVIPLDKYATAVPNIVLGTLLVLFPFVVKKSDLKLLIRKEILLFTTLIVFLLLNNLLFHDISTEITVIKKVLSALVLIVLFIPLEKTENLLKTLIISVGICMIICLFNLYEYYSEEGAFNFSAGSVINDVLIIDRLYLGFLCVLSIISSIALIGKQYNEYNKWYFTNIVFCIVFVLLISSRIAILLLLLLFLLKVFYARGKKEYIIFLVGVVVLTIASFLINKNLNERFFYSHSTQKDEKSYFELFMDWEPRAIIWQCNYDLVIAGERLLAGNGFYGTKDKLVDCYEEKVTQERRRAYFVAERFNPHNQYVDFLISAGILACVLFVLILVLLFQRNRKSFYRTAFLLSIAAFMFIESNFHRQMGAYIFAITMLLIMFPLREENQRTKANRIEDEKD